MCLVLLFSAPIFAGILLLEAFRIQKSKPGYYSAHPDYSGEEGA